MVHSNDSVTIYLNGGNAARWQSGDIQHIAWISNEIRPSEHALRIGARTNQGSNYEALTGKITDVRLWNVSRSDAEIAANYNTSLSQPARTWWAGIASMKAMLRSTAASIQPRLPMAPTPAMQRLVRPFSASPRMAPVETTGMDQPDHWSRQWRWGISENAGNDVLAAKAGSSLSRQQWLPDLLEHHYWHLHQ